MLYIENSLTHMLSISSKNRMKTNLSNNHDILAYHPVKPYIRVLLCDISDITNYSTNIYLFSHKMMSLSVTQEKIKGINFNDR